MATKSRKKRKRDRVRAEANADRPELKKGFGSGLPMKRRDCQLIAKAYREGWGIDSKTHRAVVRDLYKFGLDETSGLRIVVSVVNSLASIVDDSFKVSVQDQLSDE